MYTHLLCQNISPSMSYLRKYKFDTASVVRSNTNFSLLSMLLWVHTVIKVKKRINQIVILKLINILEILLFTHIVTELRICNENIWIKLEKNAQLKYFQYWALIFLILLYINITWIGSRKHWVLVFCNTEQCHHHPHVCGAFCLHPASSLEY